MNDLVKVEKENVLTVFTTDKGLDPLLVKINEQVENFKHDLKTEAGRKRTASLGHSVARSKVYLDDLGKGLVSEWKNNAKVVDSERKRMRDQLDELKVKALEPLTKWKEEQAEIARIAAEQLAAEKLQQEIDELHDYAILFNDDFDRNKAQELRLAKEAEELAEKNRLQREEELKADAALQAKQEAEKVAKELAEKVEADKKAATEAIEQAKRDAIAAEARSKLIAEQSAQREKEAAEKAKQDEINRQAAEEARIKAEADAREANRKHVGGIRKAAKEALMSECGLDEKQAKAAVIAINSKLIPNVSIQY